MSNGAKGQIYSEKVVILNLFANFWFSVPVYQRPYVWGKDEITELIDDVNYASKHNPLGQYFLGSMVLRKAQTATDGVNFEEYELLDGQQRLTTLYLMLASIRDRVNDEKLKEACRKMLYQEENIWENIPGRNRIVYTIRDNIDTFIESFVKPNGGTLNPDLIEFEKSKILSLANMAQGLRTIRECFNDPERFMDDEALGCFIKFLLNNALFIYVATEDLDDAFRLFTILNDRGIPLSNSDILKARNLGALNNSNEKNKWAEYWEEIEGELGRDEFDRFLSLVRTIYVKDKARESLLKEFNERIYCAKPPQLTLGEDTFKAVKEYKTAYDETILFSSCLSSSLGNEYRNHISIMRRGLPSTDWIPPVLAWFRKFKSKGLLDLVKLLDNKFSADWILQLTPTQRIQNMNEVLKVIEQSETPDDVLTARVFGYDRGQLLTLLDGPIYGRRFAKYVLLRLEHIYFLHSSSLNLPDELSVEHILPQKPAVESQWAQDFTQEQQEFWQHRLGNLMLLSRIKNTSLGNLDFIEKKKRYFKNRVETLPNSVRVLNLPCFDPPKLSERHRELMEQLRDSY
jgi:uncharacterized protein with ParB-like and HNH nuclease domain